MTLRGSDKTFIKYRLESTQWSIKGVIIDIVDYCDYYTLRLYRSNFNPDHYEVDKRTAFLLELNQFLSEVNDIGIPCYLEIFEDVDNEFKL